MFRIEIFVEDRNLVKFLNAVVGLVSSMTPPQPVVNIAVSHEKIKAASNGTLPATFYAELKKKKRSEFTTQDIKKYLEETGKSPLSYTYVIQYLRDQKLVTMVSRGNYKVK